MGETIWGKILDNPLQFVAVIIAAAIALYIIGRGLVEFLDRIMKIITTLLTEISGKAQPKQAALINILLLILIAGLSFLAIFPSLLAQLGFIETDSVLGYYVVLIIALCITGIWSGHFIRQFYIEGNAYKGYQRTKVKKKKNTELLSS